MVPDMYPFLFLTAARLLPFLPSPAVVSSLFFVCFPAVFPLKKITAVLEGTFHFDRVFVKGKLLYLLYTCN